MQFSDFKTNVIRPQKQIIIDKKIFIKDVQHHFISLYLKDNKINLLVLTMQDNENINTYIPLNPKTKRQELLSSLEHGNNQLPSIDKIVVNGINLHLKSGKYNYSFMQPDDYLALNYIINLGLDLSYLDDIDLSNINIHHSTFDQMSSDIFDHKVFDISASITNHATQHLVNKDITLSFNEINDHYFVDDCIRFDYTARLVEMDFWNVIIPEQMKQFKERNIEVDFDEITLIYEDICPRDMNLLCVAYKSDYQLNFYLKDYLDCEPEPSNKSSSSLLYDNDSDEKYCILKPIPKGTIYNLNVELFSYYTTFTTEKINLN